MLWMISQIIDMFGFTATGILYYLLVGMIGIITFFIVYTLFSAVIVLGFLKVDHPYFEYWRRRQYCKSLLYLLFALAVTIEISLMNILNWSYGSDYIWVSWLIIGICLILAYQNVHSFMERRKEALKWKKESENAIS